MTPQTEAGRDVLARGAPGSISLALLDADDILAIEAQSYARALADVRREVGAAMFVITEGENGMQVVGYNRVLAILDRLAEPQP